MYKNSSLIVNFINIKRTYFSYERPVLAAFSSYMYVEKAAETDVRMKNVRV